MTWVVTFGRWIGLTLRRKLFPPSMAILTFTASGGVRRFRLSDRDLFRWSLVCTFFLCLTLLSFALGIRGAIGRSRLATLEQQNQFLTTLLEDQAAQLAALKREIQRLHELESSLRSLSGVELPPHDPAALSQGGGIPSPATP